MYTHDADVWDLSIVAFHFLSPRQTTIQFATFPSLYAMRPVTASSAMARRKQRNRHVLSGPLCPGKSQKHS
jgi:hypothetical protein